MSAQIYGTAVNMMALATYKLRHSRLISGRIAAQQKQLQSVATVTRVYLVRPRAPNVLSTWLWGSHHVRTFLPGRTVNVPPSTLQRPHSTRAQPCSWFMNGLRVEAAVRPTDWKCALCNENPSHVGIDFEILRIRRCQNKFEQDMTVTKRASGILDGIKAPSLNFRNTITSFWYFSSGRL